MEGSDRAVISGGDFRDITLKKGKDTRVELNFGGFTDVPYCLTVRIGNVGVNLTIYPKEKTEK